MEKSKSRYIEAKLNRIFIKDGYVPSRGNQTYKKLYKGIALRRYVNCMGHACFNLTNEQFEHYNIKMWDDDSFYFDEMFDSDLSWRVNATNIKDFIKDIGLKVENSSPRRKLKDWRSWKVALYFHKNKDYHFLLQENDGEWSGKSGGLGYLEYFKKLPKKYDGYWSGYELFDCFSITNPNADGNNKFINRENLTCVNGLMKHLRESKLKEFTGKEIGDFEFEK